MSEKSVLFMARTTRLHDFVRSLASSLDVEVHVATPDSPAAAHDFDLLVLDGDGVAFRPRGHHGQMAASSAEVRPCFLVLDEENLIDLHMPSQVALRLHLLECERGRARAARPPAVG